MARFGFVSGSYTSQSPNADDERTANWYVERLEQQGKSNFALYPTPGLRLAISLNFEPNKPVRALWNMGTGVRQRLFAIVGDTASSRFYEVTVNNGSYAFTLISGSLLPSPGIEPNVSICSGAGNGGTVLMVIDGFTYIFSSGTGFVNISASFPGTSNTRVAYSDGFYLATDGFTLRASAPLDAATWPGTSVTSISVFPDQSGIIGLAVLQRQPWILGQTSGVVYYDSGNSPFPFDLIEGSYIEQGIAAADSLQVIDNTLIWLGQDVRGQCIVWRANGYTPQRISNHAVEFAIQGYRRTPAGGADRFDNGIRTAKAYTYQDQGHSFYVLYFPSANSGNGATWVYDVATQMWHERFFLNNDVEQAHRSQCHAYWVPTDTGTQAILPGRHLVGDWQATGNVYEMQIPTANGTGGWNFADDFENKIQRVRRAPHINVEKEWIFHNEITVDLESGLGTIPPPTLLPFSPVTDDFNRANGPLVAPWVPFLNVPQIVGNAVQPVAIFPANPSFAYYSGPIWPDNQYSKATIVALSNGVHSGFAPIVRYTQNATTAMWYQGNVVGNGFTSILLQEMDLASQVVTSTLLNNGFFIVNPGDVVEFDVKEGKDCISALALLVNGAVILSASDDTIQSGSPGIGVAATLAVTDAIIDNWEAGTFAENLEPQVMLRWSDDGGHRWSNEYLMGAGLAGQYNKRVVRRRLGKSRQRVYEIKCSDAIPWRITDAYLKASPAYAPEERLISRAAKSA